MSENRLAGLTSMAINYYEAKYLETDVIIKRFIEKHPRRLFCESILFDKQLE